MNNLKGKVAVITGGASGLGKATAKRLNDEGCKIVIADINEDGEQVAQDLNDAIFIKTDVTKHEEVKNTIDKTVDKYGSCDIIFNNA